MAVLNGTVPDSMGVVSAGHAFWVAPNDTGPARYITRFTHHCIVMSEQGKVLRSGRIVLNRNEAAANSHDTGSASHDVVLIKDRVVLTRDDIISNRDVILPNQPGIMTNRHDTVFSERCTATDSHDIMLSGDEKTRKPDFPHVISYPYLCLSE
ncbi:hypothetical protein [Parapedobacter tibetensis]|uniref:hypothetical protein n=1 Tax=Parapedobacter tibetensis TaxID=2972951 RepID=UPI00214D3AFC|nr:hypothetical protein [Parapedobacter tibetensis]